MSSDHEHRTLAARFAAQRGGGSGAVTPRRRRTLLLGVIALAAALGALAAAQTTTLPARSAATAYPLNVVDDLGNDVVLLAAPQRIVAMAPSHTETVCALAACDRLVGVDLNSNFPAEVAERATLGSAFAPDLEALIALEPDLVLVDEYSSLSEALRPYGIAVYAGTPQTYAETLAFVLLLGEMLDSAEAAAELVSELESAVAEVSAALADVTPTTVFLEIDATPYAAGRGSYLDELLGFAGGVNVLPESLGQFPQVDPEYVVATDPQVIVLLDAPYGVTATEVAQRPGWSGIAAVTAGRVHELDASEVDVLSRAGPRLAEAVRLLARLLHPELMP